MAETTFIKFLFREDWTSLKEVLSAYGSDYGQIHDITDEKQLTKVMLESQPTMVLASVKSKEDVAKILGFLKANRRLIKENSIKFAAVNFTYNRQVETALMKIGCQEVLDPGVKGKALKYKLDFWKKALAGAQPKIASESSLAVKDKSAQASSADLKVEPVKWIDGLKCVDDMWLMRHTDHAKKILGTWLVKFMGPSPFVGQWTEAVAGKKGVWKYVFKPEIREEFHNTDNGVWYFLGEQKPEFIWKENLWMVTGKAFQLVYQDGDTKLKRFESNSTNLIVCKNSSYAKSREAAIIETFDQEVMVKKGIITDSATAIEKDNEVAGHYKGETEGEAAIENKPMEGKSSTDDLGGNLEGAVGEQLLDDTGPYSGKSSTDSIDDVPEGKSGGENLGATKYKGKLKHEKDDRKAEYGGVSETDDLGPSHYSNQTESGATVEKDKKNTLSRDQLPKGEMNGDLETEDLGPAHYSNKKKTPEEQIRDKEHKLTKDPVAKGEMNGELETEDLGPAHYSNEKKSSEEQLKDKHHKLKKDPVTKGELSGDIETDDLGSSHYSKPAKDKLETKKEVEEESELAEEDGKTPVSEDGQEEYFRQQKEKKKKKLEAYKAGTEAEEQREKAKQEEKEKERIEKQKTETAAKRQLDESSPSAEIESSDGKVVPILRDKANKTAKSAGTATSLGLEEEESEVSPDYAAPAVTANAVVTASVRKNGSNVEHVAHVDDFFDNQIIMRVSSDQFKGQDSIEISLCFDYMKKVKKIEVKGLCVESNDDGEGSTYLTIEMAQQDSKVFEQFMKLYELRQAHVMEFIKQAKGL